MTNNDIDHDYVDHDELNAVSDAHDQLKAGTFYANEADARKTMHDQKIGKMTDQPFTLKINDAGIAAVIHAVALMASTSMRHDIDGNIVSLKSWSVEGYIASMRNQKYYAADFIDGMTHYETGIKQGGPEEGTVGIALLRDEHFDIHFDTFKAADEHFHNQLRIAIDNDDGQPDDIANARISKARFIIWELRYKQDDMPFIYDEAGMVQKFDEAVARVEAKKNGGAA